MNYKEKILDLIKHKPKAYATIIKNTPELIQWVTEHSIIKSDTLIDHIRSAVYNETNVCPHGNLKKVKRISQGFAGCGPASVCKCTKTKISASVTVTKQLITSEMKIASNQRRIDTMIGKYGVPFNSQRQEIKSILQKPKISEDSYTKLTNKEWLDTEYNINERTLVDIAAELGVYYSTVGEYCRKFGFVIRQVTNYSQQEVEIANFIKSLGVAVETNNWSILKTSEIDILVPDYNFGIEVNGLYWHSYSPMSSAIEYKERHIDKTINAKSCGIELIHITDYEWINKQPIIKNIITSKLQLNKKVYARKCILKQVNRADEKTFLNNYHLQGHVPSKHAVGLYNNNQLVMLISVGVSRFSKNTTYEILRVCSAPGITVVGGLSKLISYIKKILPNSSFVTYCDLSKSSGNAYRQVGMTCISNTGPGYFWTDGTEMISRFKTFKKTLATWLLTYDPSKTVDENMFNSKYRKYWDCGNIVFNFTS